jgi:hypothetical protein
LDELSFHESTVVNLECKGSRIILSLAEVTVGESKTSVVIEVTEVSVMTVDGSVTDTVAMECADGEVLCLDILADGVFAIVQWNDFVAHRSFTHSYRVEGRDVRLAVGPNGTV